MLPRKPHQRELLATLAICAAALLYLLVHVALADGTEPHRVEVYQCDHAHYERYEDGSGRLKCGDTTMVIVEVSR